MRVVTESKTGSSDSGSPKTPRFLRFFRNRGRTPKRDATNPAKLSPVDRFSPLRDEDPSLEMGSVRLPVNSSISKIIVSRSRSIPDFIPTKCQVREDEEEEESIKTPVAGASDDQASFEDEESFPQLNVAEIRRQEDLKSPSTTTSDDTGLSPDFVIRASSKIRKEKNEHNKETHSKPSEWGNNSAFFTSQNSFIEFFHSLKDKDFDMSGSKSLGTNSVTAFPRNRTAPVTLPSDNADKPNISTMTDPLEWVSCAPTLPAGRRPMEGMEVPISTRTTNTTTTTTTRNKSNLDEIYTPDLIEDADTPIHFNNDFDGHLEVREQIFESLISTSKEKRQEDPPIAPVTPVHGSTKTTQLKSSPASSVLAAWRQPLSPSSLSQFLTDSKNSSPLSMDTETEEKKDDDEMLARNAPVAVKHIPSSAWAPYRRRSRSELGSPDSELLLPKDQLEFWDSDVSATAQGEPQEDEIMIVKEKQHELMIVKESAADFDLSKHRVLLGAKAVREDYPDPEDLPPMSPENQGTDCDSLMNFAQDDEELFSSQRLPSETKMRKTKRKKKKKPSMDFSQSSREHRDISDTDHSDFPVVNVLESLFSCGACHSGEQHNGDESVYSYDSEDLSSFSVREDFGSKRGNVELLRELKSEVIDTARALAREGTQLARDGSNVVKKMLQGNKG